MIIFNTTVYKIFMLEKMLQTLHGSLVTKLTQGDWVSYSVMSFKEGFCGFDSIWW